MLRLAGLVATELGRIPAVGDTLEVAGWRMEVLDAAGRRAARVLLHAPLADAHPQDATDEGPGAESDGRRHGMTREKGARR
ncbi:hemolysin family protein [Streptomyces hirsutus]